MWHVPLWANPTWGHLGREFSEVPLSNHPLSTHGAPPYGHQSCSLFDVSSRGTPVSCLPDRPPGLGEGWGSRRAFAGLGRALASGPRHPLELVGSSRPLACMRYSRERDWPRVCGLALEAADRARATGLPLESCVVLNPGDEKREVTVTEAEEPRLPALLRWAEAAKAHIDAELEASSCVVRGPLEFRGPGPRSDFGTWNGGVQTVAVVGWDKPSPQQERMNVDLRFAIRDTAEPCPPKPWWSCLGEQKFSLSLGTAQEAALGARDGKLLRAAKGGRFELPGMHEGGTPITARAAACASLAVTPTEWSFEARVREDWGGFPSGLARFMHGALPAGVPFPHGLQAKAAPAAKPAAKPGSKPAPETPPPVVKPIAKGGRAHKPTGRAFRCDGPCDFRRKRGTASEDVRKDYGCARCGLQPPQYTDVQAKFQVKRCAPGRCRWGPGGMCTICKRKPLH